MCIKFADETYHIIGQFDLRKKPYHFVVSFFDEEGRNVYYIHYSIINFTTVLSSIHIP